MKSEEAVLGQMLRLVGRLARAGGAVWREAEPRLRQSRAGRAALAAVQEIAEARGAAPRSIAVWDVPTRVSKWLLVLFVLAAFLFSSMRPTGLLFAVHVACGYAVVVLLLFRVGWGFVGGEQARFRAFLRGWRAVRRHGEALLGLNPEEVAGHNPLGGWMIVLMLGALGVTAVTGLLTEGSTGGGGAMSTLLSARMVGAVGWIHGTLGFAVMWLAGIHVGGVVVESLLHRENLVRAMITGQKRVRAPGLADARAVSPWRAVPLVLVLALIGAWMVAGTRLPGAAAAAHAGVVGVGMGVAGR